MIIGNGSLRGNEKCGGIVGHTTVVAAAVNSLASGNAGNGGAVTRLDKILSIEKFDIVELEI